MLVPGAAAPDKMDVFSDGTPCEGDPDEVEVQFSGKAISQRHVSSNPHAGEVRRVEAASGVWMTKAKTEIETENAKAREQADQKRLIGLAKQTQIGLANIGVKYEMVSKDSNTTPFFTTANPHFLFNHLAPCTRQTSIANILRLAFSHQGRHDTVIADEEVRTAIEILHAAKQYDCHLVSRLLGCEPPRAQSFGVPEAQLT